MESGKVGVCRSCSPGGKGAQMWCLESYELGQPMSFDKGTMFYKLGPLSDALYQSS